MRINQRRQAIYKTFRKEQIDSIMGNMREQIVDSINRKREREQMEDILIIAYQEVHKEEVDYLNVYVNIEPLLKVTLLSCQADQLNKKLALWLFIKLTQRQEVLQFMVEEYPKEEWKHLIFLISKQEHCREYFYERMTVFLKLARQKISNQTIQFLCSRQTTSFLIDLTPVEDSQSFYHQFMAEYINLMPEQHIMVFINSGFVSNSMQFQSRLIWLAIMDRLNFMGGGNGYYRQVIEDLIKKKQKLQCLSSQ